MALGPSRPVYMAQIESMNCVLMGNVFPDEVKKSTFTCPANMRPNMAQEVCTRFVLLPSRERKTLTMNHQAIVFLQENELLLRQRFLSPFLCGLDVDV